MCAEDAGDRPAEQTLPVFMRRRMPRVELVVRNSMQLVGWEMGFEPHTEAGVARTMNATLGFLAGAGGVIELSPAQPPAWEEPVASAPQALFRVMMLALTAGPAARQPEAPVVSLFALLSSEVTAGTRLPVAPVPVPRSLSMAVRSVIAWSSAAVGVVLAPVVAASAFAHCPLIAWSSVKSLLMSLARVLPLSSTDSQVSVPVRVCSASGLVDEELAHPARAATTAAQAAKVRGFMRLAPVISKQPPYPFPPSDKTRSTPAMVRTASDCYQDETLCDGTVTAWLRDAVRAYWRVDPPDSDAGDVTLVEKDVVAGVGAAVPRPVEVAGVGVGVWLGVWATLGVGE